MSATTQADNAATTAASIIRRTVNWTRSILIAGAFGAGWQGRFWQQYRIYRDRLELQAWILFHTVVVPIGEIRAIDVRPSVFSGRKGFTPGIKLEADGVVCSKRRHRGSFFEKRKPRSYEPASAVLRNTCNSSSPCRIDCLREFSEDIACGFLKIFDSEMRLVVRI